MYLEDQLKTNFTRGNHIPMLKNDDCCLFVRGGCTWKIMKTIWRYYVPGKIMKTRCLKMYNILDTFNMILLAGVE